MAFTCYPGVWVLVSFSFTCFSFHRKSKLILVSPTLGYYYLHKNILYPSWAIMALKFWMRRRHFLCVLSIFPVCPLGVLLCFAVSPRLGRLPCCPFFSLALPPLPSIPLGLLGNLFPNSSKGLWVGELGFWVFGLTRKCYDSLTSSYPACWLPFKNFKYQKNGFSWGWSCLFRRLPLGYTIFDFP